MTGGWYHLQAMTKEPGGASDDSQAQAVAFGMQPRRVSYLVELVEDCVEHVGRDARSGIEDIDPQHPAAVPAANQNPPRCGMANGVGQQVAQDAFQQHHIAVQHCA
jgi:hypothetical protein